jgi:hypothetical protein
MGLTVTPQPQQNMSSGKSREKSQTMGRRRNLIVLHTIKADIYGCLNLPTWPWCMADSVYKSAGATFTN